MFRRTLPTVALTALALLASAFALNRPGERVVIAIDRASKVPDWALPGRFHYEVEGRVDDGGATYRRVESIALVLLDPVVGPGSGDPWLGDELAAFDSAAGRFRVLVVQYPVVGPISGRPGLRDESAAFDPATGRFRFKADLLLPPRLQTASLAVAAYDRARRAYVEPVVFDH